MIGTSNQAMEIAAFEKQFDSRIKEFIVLTEGSHSAGKGGNAVL